MKLFISTMFYATERKGRSTQNKAQSPNWYLTGKYSSVLVVRGPSRCGGSAALNSFINSKSTKDRLNT